MSMKHIIQAVHELPHALVVSPQEGGPHPELAWGDSFFYFAPDGRMPENTQPYGTIITKDYPGDTTSALGHGRWRLNIHLGRGASILDERFFPHPVYGSMGWISVITPPADALDTSTALLREAHERARERYERRRISDRSSRDSTRRPSRRLRR